MVPVSLLVALVAGRLGGHLPLAKSLLLLEDVEHAQGGLDRWGTFQFCLGVAQLPLQLLRRRRRLPLLIPGLLLPLTLPRLLLSLLLLPGLLLARLLLPLLLPLLRLALLLTMLLLPLLLLPLLLPLLLLPLLLPLLVLLVLPLLLLSLLLLLLLLLALVQASLHNLEVELCVHIPGVDLERVLVRVAGLGEAVLANVVVTERVVGAKADLIRAVGAGPLRLRDRAVHLAEAVQRVAAVVDVRGVVRRLHLCLAVAVQGCLVVARVVCRVSLTVEPPRLVLHGAAGQHQRKLTGQVEHHS